MARACSIPAWLLAALASCTVGDGNRETRFARDAGDVADSAVLDSAFMDVTSDTAECLVESVAVGEASRGADVIWYVDNSDSMLEEAARVQANINAFAETVAAEAQDFHVVMLSSTASVHVPSPLGTSEDFFQIDERMGDLHVVETIVDRYAEYEHMLRPETSKHIVLVTDADGCLRGDEMAALLETVPALADAPVHVVVGVPDRDPEACTPQEIIPGCTTLVGCAGCGDTYGGVKAMQLAELTGGLQFSICDEDWTPLFDTLASTIVAAATIPCAMQIPDPSPGQSVDPDRVNFVLRDGEDPEEVVSRVDAAEDCGSDPGWYYDDPILPTQLVMCPVTCERLQADDEGNIVVSAQFGCETIVR